MSVAHKNYDELFSLDNIFKTWAKFRRGKTGKNDVMNFELHLEDNLFSLYEDLHNGVSPFRNELGHSVLKCPHEEEREIKKSRAV